MILSIVALMPPCFVRVNVDETGFAAASDVATSNLNEFAPTTRSVSLNTLKVTFVYPWYTATAYKSMPCSQYTAGAAAAGSGAGSVVVPSSLVVGSAGAGVSEIFRTATALTVFFPELLLATNLMHHVKAFQRSQLAYEQYLIILGNARAMNGQSCYQSFDYRGYVYNYDLGKFEMIQ